MSSGENPGRRPGIEAVNPSGDLVVQDGVSPGHTGDLVLDDRDDMMVIELMRDGRLRAPRQRTRETLRERIRRAEVLKTGPGWAVMRTLDPPIPPVWSKEAAEENREVVMAGVLSPSGLAVIDMIGFLAQGLQTGVLTVSLGEHERSVFLSQGDVVWASSTAPEDGLGEFLVRRGKITPHQLSQVARTTPDRIGRTCVERGFVAAHELWTLVQQQLTEVFERLLATERGVWFFSRVTQEYLQQSELQLSTQGLLMDALRRLDEMRVYREVIRTSTAVVSRTEEALKGNDERLLARVDKDVREAASELLTHLRKIATIQDLIRSSGKGEYEVTQLIYHLSKAKIVSVAGQQRPSLSPMPPEELGVTPVREILHVYSMAIVEIFNELGEEQRQILGQAAEGFLRDPATPYAAIFKDVLLRDDGKIEEAGILASLSTAQSSASDFNEGLSELLFFLLFEATEMLPARRRDDLARRVKMIHGMLRLPGERRPDSGSAEE